MDDELERRFDDAFVEAYRRTYRETGYNATRVLDMFHDHGGVASVQRLLESKNEASGFTAMWELGRLDLTLEVLVLRAEWASLFTDHERQIARGRLQDYGYSP